MTPGGALVIGTTVLVAWIDGGLTTLCVASAVGGGAYYATRRRFDRSPSLVLENQRAILEENLNRRIAAKASDDEIKVMRKEMKAQLERLEKTATEQWWGNNEMATVTGVASFACPLLGATVIAGMTSRDWLPAFEDGEVPEEPPVEQFFVDHAVLRRAYAATA